MYNNQLYIQYALLAFIQSTAPTIRHVVQTKKTTNLHNNVQILTFNGGEIDQLRQLQMVVLHDKLKTNDSYPLDTTVGNVFDIIYRYTKPNIETIRKQTIYGSQISAYMAYRNIAVVDIVYCCTVRRPM